MTEDNDNSVARALLARAVTAEPALDLDPRALARAGRRRVARRRAAVTGGVAVAVAAAVLGTSLLTAPSRGQELQVAGAGPSEPVKPPPSAPPDPSGDARSQRLTAAFAAAHLIPAGMTAEKSPDGLSLPGMPAIPEKPLEFFRSTTDNYQAYARLRDSRGYGRLVINMDPTMPFTDVLNCSAVTWGSCTERTFPDGSRARVHTMPAPGSTTLRLTVSRPNGSFLEAYVDNRGELASPGHQNPVTRDKPPLSVEQLFLIAATPTITY